MSKHFQILVAGTVVFAVAIVLSTNPPHTNTFEAQAATGVDCILFGMWMIAGYLAFVSLIIGHALLRK